MAGKANNLRRVPVSRSPRADGLKRTMRARSKGQALIIIALAMTVLVLFVGLAVDAGNLMSRRGKLQSAVDSAALSGAQLLGGTSSSKDTAKLRAYQILEANGVFSNTLNTAQTSVTFPTNAPNQIVVSAVQRVDTFFMRIIPAFATMEISAEATADLNSYAEIITQPSGKAGVVSALNLMVWGDESLRSNGDAYSTKYQSGTADGLNPWYSEQPYGYLFRIDVPASYPYDRLAVQIFDPDSYNRNDVPPTWPASPTPYPTVHPLYGQAQPSPTTIPDQYAACNNPRPQPPGTNCPNGNGISSNPYMKLNGFANPADLASTDPNDGRTAFWRVDEYRCRYTASCGDNDAAQYLVNNQTQTQYTLYHFNPNITSAFGDPDQLSDKAGSGSKYLARYKYVRTGTDADKKTDLRWYQPPGFDIKLRDASDPSCNWTGNACFEPETTGGFYFYLYVQGQEGYSENNYDLRVGPPNSEDSSNPNCTDSALGSTPYTTRCYVNQLYFDQVTASGVPDWNDGSDNDTSAAGMSKSARIFAKRALPLNLDAGVAFPLVFTQVSRNSAGQTLAIRHFDQDCNGQGTCGSTMNYQMQVCDSGYPFDDPRSWASVGTGYRSPNGGWYCTVAICGAGMDRPPAEYINIPDENSQFFKKGATECTDSWLRIESNPSYSNDTTVWEMPFLRPRLIK